MTYHCSRLVVCSGVLAALSLVGSAAFAQAVESESAAEASPSSPEAEAKPSSGSVEIVGADTGQAAQPAPPGSARSWQGAPYLHIQYSTAIPLGTTSDFVGDYSFGGFRARGAYFLLDSLNLGVSVGLNWFDDKKRTTESTENSALTATRIQSLSSLSMLLTSDYFVQLLPNGIRAYLGGGLGAYRTRRTTDIGLAAVERAGWHFGIAPELGVAFPLGGDHITLGTEFNYVVKSGSSPEELLMTFNIGLGSVFD